MGYHHVEVDGLEPTPDRPSVQRAVADAVGFEHVAVNRYEVAPGEQVPLAYHVHDEQEELFYVLAGRMHVETPEGEYEVDADEAFAVEPGNAQRAYVPGAADGEAVVLAIGAPRVNDARAYEPDQ